eukprot:TRINITY_DN4095_c0_g1_i2.p1 TRINITY_DN4095_c0_g1~~TRINITY_DN4095_c0_g1_i2.p1  ORF type:complete len:276 (-),score=65.57 TRINITY_DN4095_c0_g1_i2:88-915(-)
MQSQATNQSCCSAPWVFLSVHCRGLEGRTITHHHLPLFSLLPHLIWGVVQVEIEPLEAIGADGCGMKWVDDDSPSDCIGMELPPEHDDDESVAGGSDDGGSDLNSETDPDEPPPDFDAEVQELVETVLEGECPPDNFTMQMNTLKMAHDTTFAECVASILQVLIERATSETNDDAPDAEYHAEINKIFVQWGKILLAPFLTTTDDQVELLCSLMDYAKEHERVKTVFQFVVWGLLQQAQLIGDEAVWGWVSRVEKQAENRQFVTLCGDFLEWLKG